MSLNPEIQVYLQALAHKTISINLHGIETIYCIFSDTYLQTSRQKPQHIDTEIFLNFNKTKVHGDSEAAHALQQLLAKINIDWEEELSKYTGDVIAHQSFYVFKQLRQYQQYASNSLEEMITEYLQEESGLLPTKYEVDEFMHDVDQLRLEVDRLEARIKICENT